jgi:hypothetical protein
MVGLSNDRVNVLDLEEVQRYGSCTVNKCQPKQVLSSSGTGRTNHEHGSSYASADATFVVLHKFL